MDNDLEASYQQALDYIYSYVDFSLTHQQNLSPENFDLGRMEALVEALGHPQHEYPVLHVAGSKGKGSVCSFCDAVLREQGYKVGLYTSPHLKDFEERIQINGESMPRADLVTFTEELKPYVEAIPRLTTFEISTALAFWYFAHQQIDVAVIEVGLGGRLDATNVVDPFVSVITTLYLEHTSILGDTIEQIAAEKAGIIKPGAPVVLAPQGDSARHVVEEIAARRGAALTRLGQEYRYRREGASLEGQTFTVWSSMDGFPSDGTTLRIPLLGPHQVDNAATAYLALQAARQEGLTISDQAIQRGFARTQWPARFEVLSRGPKPVVVDSAHNPGAAHKLQQTLDEFFPHRRIWLVFGVSEDKDVNGILEAIGERIDKIYCAASDHPRAMEARGLAAKARFLGKPVEVIPNVGNALEAALAEAPDETLILVTGSIFVAATGRIAWFERLKLVHG